ncbi:MAG: hypothetical protein IOC54_10510 [Methylobacterium sp.]|nr:hypothetical protein [Methylobacterium sp.]MCA3652260.1 hypothetical protein [Methylobacterium sp.]MCA4922385.1 hypothetical protein [Methylobacterium sp.]
MTDLAQDHSSEAAILALDRSDRTASGTMQEPDGNAENASWDASWDASWGASWGAFCLFDLTLEPPVVSPMGIKAEPILMKGLLMKGLLIKGLLARSI